MKKLYWMLALAMGGSACQQQAPPMRKVTVVKTGITTLATAPIKVKSIDPVTPAASTDSLTPEMATTLREVNISKLFLAPRKADDMLILDGFIGKSTQRLSLAILRVVQDSLKPGLFHVVGKSRYKRLIDDFEGTIEVNSLADFHDQGRLLSVGDSTIDTLTAHAYSAYARFDFRSHNTNRLYRMTGQGMLDFLISNRGEIDDLHSPLEGWVDEKAPSKGSGLLLQGNWLDVASDTSKPFIVSRDVFLISPALIDDFGIGDRGAQVNPKYAKLGWNTYWENDEWWAGTPTARL